MIPPSARMMSPPTLYVGERLRKLRFLMTDNSSLLVDSGNERHSHPARVSTP
jgi:hypothetical protein